MGGRKKSQRRSLEKIGGAVYAVLNWRGQWKRQGDSKIPKQGETLTKHMPKPSPTQPPLEPQHQEENSIWMTRSE